MFHRAMTVVGGWATAMAIGGAASGAESPVVPKSIVTSPSKAFAERLAAREIRRYVYLRTTRLLPIVDGSGDQAEGAGDRGGFEGFTGSEVRAGRDLARGSRGIAEGRTIRAPPRSSTLGDRWY